MGVAASFLRRREEFFSGSAQSSSFSPDISFRSLQGSPPICQHRAALQVSCKGRRNGEGGRDVTQGPLATRGDRRKICSNLSYSRGGEKYFATKGGGSIFLLGTKKMEFTRTFPGTKRWGIRTRTLYRGEKIESIFTTFPGAKRWCTLTPFTGAKRWYILVPFQGRKDGGYMYLSRGQRRLRKKQLAHGKGEGMGEEPNKTTRRKPGPP